MLFYLLINIMWYYYARNEKYYKKTYSLFAGAG